MNKEDYLKEYEETIDTLSYLNNLENNKDDKGVSLFLSSIYESGNKVDISYKKALSYLNGDLVKKERLLFLLRHLNESIEENGDLFSLKELDELFISNDKEILKIKNFYDEFYKHFNDGTTSDNKEVNLLISALKEYNKDENSFYNDFSALLELIDDDLYSFYFIGKLLLIYIPIYTSRNNTQLQILFLKKIMKTRPDLKYGQMLNALGLCYLDLITNCEVTSQEEFKIKSKEYALFAKEYFTKAAYSYNLNDAKENLNNFDKLFDSILNEKKIEVAKKTNQIFKISTYILLAIIIIAVIITIVLTSVKK